MRLRAASAALIMAFALSGCGVLNNEMVEDGRFSASRNPIEFNGDRTTCTFNGYSS